MMVLGLGRWALVFVRVINLELSLKMKFNPRPKTKDQRAKTSF